MVQAELLFLTKEGKFDASKVPQIRMFNEYMGAEAFQEIREAQGLAYSVSSFYNLAPKKDENDYYYAYVGTQADKQVEFRIIKRVMFSCASAGFGNINFATLNVGGAPASDTKKDESASRD